MSTADVRAAAERLTGPYDHVYWDGNAANRPELDSQIVAEDYLADHLVDDDEPVTAEWLKSVGFEIGDYGIAVIQNDDYLVLEMHTDGKWAEAYQAGNEDGIRLPDLLTRGDVRRVCSAIGITVSGQR